MVVVARDAVGEVVVRFVADVPIVAADGAAGATIVDVVGAVAATTVGVVVAIGMAGAGGAPGSLPALRH